MLFGNISDAELHEKAIWSSQILFLAVISCLWFGCNNTAKEIVKERNIYSRERAANLSGFSYYASKFVFFGIVGGLQAGLLWFIVMMGTKIDVGFLAGLVLLVSLATVGTVLGLCISVFSKTEEFASSMVPLVIIPQIILAGFIHKVEGILWLISSLFIPAYWGYGGAASLLEKSMREMLIPKMDDWNYLVVALLALTVQLVVLAGISLFQLSREKGD